MMETNTRDVEYGYPFLERGISFVSSTRISVLDVMRYEVVCDGSVVVEDVNKQHELKEGQVEKWLLKDPKRGIQIRDDGDDRVVKKKFVGALRVLYGACTYDTELQTRVVPLQKSDYARVEERMGIPEQYLPGLGLSTGFAYSFASPASYLHHEVEGEDHVPFRPEVCHVIKFSIYNPAYYHLAISHSPIENVTYMLLLSKTSDHSFPSLIESLISPSHDFDRLSPFAVPFLLASFCYSSSDFRIRSADIQLNELEETTGQHEWSNRPRGDPLAIDFLKVGARLNFIARTLGVEKVRVLGLSDIMGEIRNINERGGKGERRVQELVGYWQNLCRMLALRVEYEEKRVQSQLAVVYQFMAQKDAKVNIDLAATSATIAKETKNDGSAMKTIAILTMCFLPGTFLAALFAMPLFNWDTEKGPLLKPRFKYYWAIAIPLTLFVLVIWAFAIFLPWEEWMTRWKTRSKRRDIEAVGKDE